MNLHRILGCVAAVLVLATPAAADEPRMLLPESLNLSVVDGSTIPTDCSYPASITDTARFELACVTMPRFASGQIAAQYLGELGRLGWRQGAYISGGMTAVSADDNNCERVLNIFPSDFPPGAQTSPTVVIWFALDRTPRCAP